MLDEEICSDCKGERRVKQYFVFHNKDMYGPCTKCEGRGKVLTEKGEDDLDAILYYIGKSGKFEPYHYPSDY